MLEEIPPPPRMPEFSDEDWAIEDPMVPPPPPPTTLERVIGAIVGAIEGWRKPWS